MRAKLHLLPRSFFNMRKSKFYFSGKEFIISKWVENTEGKGDIASYE